MHIATTGEQVRIRSLYDRISRKSRSERKRGVGCWLMICISPSLQRPMHRPTTNHRSAPCREGYLAGHTKKLSPFSDRRRVPSSHPVKRRGSNGEGIACTPLRRSTVRALTFLFPPESANLGCCCRRFSAKSTHLHAPNLGSSGAKRRTSPRSRSDPQLWRVFPSVPMLSTSRTGKEG